MRRLRRAVIRLTRPAGSVLGIITVVFFAGLGIHAARDWHHHGEFGAGFFHLHFHVGDHDHEDHDHDHGEPSDRKTQRTAVLTVAQALDGISGLPSMVPPTAKSERTLVEPSDLPRFTLPPTVANPRAPPA